ncbi:MAG: HIT family protein [Acidimicrobiales bacterium]|nr:HIT family protein [Acidimicrobiales bacterium]
MASVYTHIIAGDLPARFVWKDDVAVAFTDINPISNGHTLVVPRAEVDHWLDLEPAVAGHCMQVAQTVGQAIMAAFTPRRVGMIIAGFDVPHTHLHVLPVHGMGDLDFGKARNPGDEALDAAARAIRAALADLGHPYHE